MDGAQSILNTRRPESDLPRIIKLFALLIQVNNTLAHLKSRERLITAVLKRNDLTIWKLVIDRIHKNSWILVWLELNCVKTISIIYCWMLLSQEEVTPSSQRFAASWRLSSTVLLCSGLKSQTFSLFFSLVIVQQHSEGGSWALGETRPSSHFFDNFCHLLILSPWGISLGRWLQDCRVSAAQADRLIFC